jgi:hypothetical protein
LSDNHSYHDPRSACFGKQAFLTQREAYEVLERIRAQRRSRDRKKLHVYRCKHCHQYHLGGNR